MNRHRLTVRGENMSSIGFYGTYARFTTPDKRNAADFLGPDNVIGDSFHIEMDYSEGKRIAYLVNPFDKRMGTIDEEVASELDICEARGWKTTALLALVAYSEDPKPGYYWGEIAIISYDPAYEDAFEPFIAQFAKKLGNGIRGDLKIGPKSLEEIVKTKGNWFPTARYPLPEKKKGTAFVKTERSGTERLVDQARKGNKGCMVASWAFILAVVALIVFGIHSCGVF